MLPDDVANLEQAGLRGLMRVIDAEHPHLRATQIDVDDETDAAQLAPATAERVRGGRDRVARRRVVHGAPAPQPAAARRTANHRRDHERRRYAPADPHAR